MHRAILKYGKENFKIELIVTVPKEQLNDAERYWIGFYKSNNRQYGYNLTPGGQDAAIHQKRLSDEDELEVIRLKTQENWTSEQLGKRYNLSKGSIRRVFDSHDLKMRNSRNLEDQVDIEEFKKFIKENKPTCKEVVERFGICRCSVYNLIKQIDDPTLVLTKGKRRSNALMHAEEVVQLYREGCNVTDLVKYFHSSKRYISKVLHDAGITPQRSRKSIEYNNSTSVRTLTDNAEG